MPSASERVHRPGQSMWSAIERDEDEDGEEYRLYIYIII